MKWMYCASVSRAEGLPLVALEAMSRGIPVISFAVGGLVELIHQPQLGWLVAPGDIDGLKKALHQWYAMDHTEKTGLSEAVQQQIRNGYCADSLVPAIEALYV